MNKKPQVGDIWLWDGFDPAYYLVLQKSDVGGNWWEALELSSGTIADIQFDSVWGFKFVS